MKEWLVTIPIAGHAELTVQAETEEQAREMAFEQVSIDEIASWEPLEQFHQGNVCCCPSPWSVEIEDCGEIDE